MAIGFSTANAIDNNERIADKSDDKFGKEIQTTVIVVFSFGLNLSSTGRLYINAHHHFIENNLLNEIEHVHNLYIDQTLKEVVLVRATL